jgi:hypothetical protein
LSFRLLSETAIKYWLPLNWTFCSDK